ncbi:MAG: hypothetical protein MJ157_04530, partial [Clostridia bacterium]|nr:hypothetical protein [Clostridia bacterium]
PCKYGFQFLAPAILTLLLVLLQLILKKLFNHDNGNKSSQIFGQRNPDKYEFPLKSIRETYFDYANIAVIWEDKTNPKIINQRNIILPHLLS